MYYYKLLIAYDGNDYYGWQWQERKKSVAGQIERSFMKAFRQKPLSFAGASRTDAGVHAWAKSRGSKQISLSSQNGSSVHFRGTLPPDIMLRAVQTHDGDFPLHGYVISKTYDYYISLTRPMPFIARYCLFYFLKFDQALLQKNLNVFLGTHDFRSFCTGDDKSDTVRTVNAISVTYLERYNLYRVRVQGPGFLRYMIRRMVGASLQTMTLQLESKLENSAEFLHTILEEKNPKQHLITAPAHGLMLREIIYDDKRSNQFWQRCCCWRVVRAVIAMLTGVPVYGKARPVNLC